MFDHSREHYRAAFAISKAAFRNFPSRTDVSTGLPSLPIGNKDGITYLILDAVYLLHGVEWKDYEDALVSAVLDHSSTENKLLVKFHPADKEASQRFQSLCSRLDSHGLHQVRLLEKNFEVEEALTQSDLVLFGTTALGYYAAIEGARVACFADAIEGLSIDSLTRKSRLPGDFRKVVGLSPE